MCTATVLGIPSNFFINITLTTALGTVVIVSPSPLRNLVSERLSNLVKGEGHRSAFLSTHDSNKYPPLHCLPLPALVLGPFQGPSFSVPCGHP